jgi:hypothetical protein
VSVAAVITGQVRNPALLHKLVEDLCSLRSEGHFDHIVLSTWADELGEPAWLHDALRARGVETLLSAPIRLDTYRNYRRQHHLLERGLAQLSPDDVAVKLRPDWVVTRETLRALSAPPEPCDAAAGFPRVFDAKVTIPWWSTRVPFHLADESFSGYVSDLRRVNRPEWAMAIADPHAGRFLPHLMEHVPAVAFAARHVLPYIADSSDDPADVVRRLSGRSENVLRRKVLQRLGPHRFELTTLALSVPSYQQALAAYFALLDRFFRVHNPSPRLDQFIARHGPWPYTTPDVSRDGDPFQSPDPVCYVGQAEGAVASRVPARFEAFHDAFRRYERRPQDLLAPPSDAAWQRDARELERLVTARRVRRARELAVSAAARAVPVRGAHDRTNGSAPHPPPVGATPVRASVGVWRRDG